MALLGAVADVLGVVEADQFVAPFEDLAAVLHRHADQLGDHLQRQVGGQVGDEVALAARRHAVDDLAGPQPDLLLEHGDAARREAEAD